jgi:ketosteroid isomerase-like protein
MSQNTDILKQGYEAYGRGDVQAVLEDWADDVKWEGGNADLPAGKEYQGKNQVMQAFQEIGEAWESFSVTPDEFVGEGDTVCVLGHAEGTPKGGGDSIKSPFVHIYRFEDGKVKRIQILTDTLTGARALGKV